MAFGMGALPIKRMMIFFVKKALEGIVSLAGKYSRLIEEAMLEYKGNNVLRQVKLLPKPPRCLIIPVTETGRARLPATTFPNWCLCVSSENSVDSGRRGARKSGIFILRGGGSNRHERFRSNRVEPVMGNSVFEATIPPSVTLTMSQCEQLTLVGAEV